MRAQTPLSIIVASIFLLPGISTADIFTLKSGEKLEGRVLSETPTELKIEYAVSAGVKDERTLKRAEVVSVEKEAPDAQAWNAIKGIALGASSMAAAQYDEMLKPLNAFLTAFPDSGHADDAKKIIAAITAEKTRVETGDVRLGEKWIAKEDAEKERYQINGTLALNLMKSQATAGNATAALNTFAGIERSYVAAGSFPDAVDLALRLLPSMKTIIDRQLVSLKNDADGRANTAEQTRRELEAAAAKDEAAGEAALANADRAGLKWPPLMMRSSKALTKVGEKIAPEIARLRALPVAKMRESFALAEKARTQLAAGDANAAEATMKQASTLWDANELGKRVNAQIVEAKKLAAAAAKPVEPPKPPELVKATPKPVVQRTAPPPPAPVAEAEPEKSPFYLTITGGITIVVAIAAVLAGLNIFKKMKARANEAAPE